MKKGDKKKDIERFEALRDAAAQIADGNFDIKKYYGITDDGLEAIYNIGYEMYNHKKYENAADVFSLLTVLEPNSTKYLSACASAQYMAENYIGALTFFKISMLNGDYNPKTLMRMSECSIKLEQFDDVRRYNNEIIKLSSTDEYKNDKEVASYAERAKMINSMLDEKDSSSFQEGSESGSGQ